MEDNLKLVERFGAKKISDLKELPDFYTFNKQLIYSHRDFDKFFKKLQNGEKSAIVSGFNASGTIHLGHKVVFDTNLFFQKKYDCQLFIPISDDESYVAGKIDNQEQGLKYAITLAKQLLAYGFDPQKTFIIIDQIYTNIYNLAIKLSRKLTLSEIRATYGYENQDNPGLFFYPTIQSAHVLLPQEFGIKNVLVPIGPDEDSHLRIARDLANRFDYEKPSVIHLKFLPGLDGQKMSKSKNNAIFLMDDERAINKKVNKAISGGKETVEEHREKGGDPQKDMSFQYLKYLFLDEKETVKLEEEYKKGKILSGEMKNLLKEHLLKYTQQTQKALENIDIETLDKALLKNKEIDYKKHF